MGLGVNKKLLEMGAPSICRLKMARGKVAKQSGNDNCATI